jgi:hypothetical protein
MNTPKYQKGDKVVNKVDGKAYIVESTINDPAGRWVGAYVLEGPLATSLLSGIPEDHLS